MQLRTRLLDKSIDNGRPEQPDDRQNGFQVRLNVLNAKLECTREPWLRQVGPPIRRDEARGAAGKVPGCRKIRVVDRAVCRVQQQVKGCTGAESAAAVAPRDVRERLGEPVEHNNSTATTTEMRQSASSERNCWRTTKSSRKTTKSLVPISE